MTTIPHQASGAVEAQGSFMALMRHRNYALIWTGQLVSQIGDRFHWVAISLWVYAQTGSALSVSYAILALLLAPAVVGLVAGALVDRLDRRRILVAADLLRAVLVAAIPWLMARGLVWVYIDLFLISAASAFFRPAMFAVIPQSVPKERLLQANAYFASMDTSTEIFGPALAGLLVASLGYSAALYVDALTFVVSAVFVGALRLSPQAPATAGAGRGAGSPRASRRARRRGAEPAVPVPAPVRSAGGLDLRGDVRPLGVAGSIRDGLNYMRRDPVQVALLGLLAGGFWVAGLNSLQTPLSKGVLGVTDAQFGWFQSIWGVGFVAASVLLGMYGGRFPRGQAIVVGYLLWALAAGTMGLAANYGMLVITGFWVGFANMLVFVNVATIMMEHTPADKIGRAITTRQVALALVRAAALLGFGWVADATSVRGAVVAMAGISLVGTLVAAARFPALWRYRVDVVAPTGEGALGLATRVGEPRLSLLLARMARAGVDPEFVVAEQRWMNGAVLTILGVGWLALLATHPAGAVGVLAVAGAAVVIAYGVRAVERWRGQAGSPGDMGGDPTA